MLFQAETVVETKRSNGVVKTANSEDLSARIRSRGFNSSRPD